MKYLLSGPFIIKSRLTPALKTKTDIEIKNRNENQTHTQTKHNAITEISVNKSEVLGLTYRKGLTLVEF